MEVSMPGGGKKCLISLVASPTVNFSEKPLYILVDHDEIKHIVGNVHIWMFPPGKDHPCSTTRLLQTAKCDVAGCKGVGKPYSMYCHALTR
eukprot:2163275-Ditylum_brightwellii.AAC.1